MTAVKPRYMTITLIQPPLYYDHNLFPERIESPVISLLSDQMVEVVLTGLH